MAQHLRLSDVKSPPERTNWRSRGSVSVTMTAATSVISATTWMAARQPITSVRMPGMKRPAKAADAGAGDIDAGDAGDVARRPFVADIGDDDGEDRRHQKALDEAPEHELRHALTANVMITVGTVMANIAAVISRLRPSTSASAPVNGADSAIAAVLAVISEEMSPAPT